MLPTPRRCLWGLAWLALTGSGCLDPVMFQRAETEVEEVEGQATAEVAAPVAPQPAQGFPQDNHEFVDLKSALAANPKLVVKDRNKVTAGDYLTAVGQTYFSAISRTEMMSLQHSINLYKAEHDDKPPSFTEFQGMVRQSKVQFKGLYRWQVYAYDEATGEMCILEDAEMKKKLYEEQGLKAD